MKKKKNLFQFWLRADLKAALVRESKRTGRSMASLIEEAVEIRFQKPKP